jgi:hypothetical protein
MLEPQGYPIAMLNCRVWNEFKALPVDRLKIETVSKEKLPMKPTPGQACVTA